MLASKWHAASRVMQIGVACTATQDHTDVGALAVARSYVRVHTAARVCVDGCLWLLLPLKVHATSRGLDHHLRTCWIRGITLLLGPCLSGRPVLHLG